MKIESRKGGGRGLYKPSGFQTKKISIPHANKYRGENTKPNLCSRGKKEKATRETSNRFLFGKVNKRVVSQRKGGTHQQLREGMPYIKKGDAYA